MITSKYFSFLIAIFSLSLFFSFPSLGANTYTTQNGSVFKAVEDAFWGTTWMDPNGNIWSPHLGVYSNLGKQDQSHKISDSGDFEMIDSPAANVCASSGGKLPSVEQFRIFFEHFKNLADFQSIFPSPANSPSTIWTANTAINENFARVVQFVDPYGDLANTTHQYSVFCVKAKAN